MEMPHEWWFAFKGRFTRTLILTTTTHYRWSHTGPAHFMCALPRMNHFPWYSCAGSCVQSLTMRSLLRRMTCLYWLYIYFKQIYKEKSYILVANPKTSAKLRLLKQTMNEARINLRLILALECRRNGVCKIKIKKRP